MPETIQRDRVLCAMRSLAKTLGMQAEISILSVRGNIIARLGESNVVARAMYLNTCFCPNPEHTLLRETAIAAALARAGTPTVALASGVRPGPYVVDGIVITLWDYITPSEETRSPTVLATHLKAFHDAAQRVAVSPPWLTPLTEMVPQALDALEHNSALDSETLLFLRREHQRVGELLQERCLTTARIIHGDSHVGNLRESARGFVWIDLEDVCRGPVEWDLACLHGSVRTDGRAAVRSYLTRTSATQSSGDGIFQTCLDARELQAGVWIAAMAHQRPEQFGSRANEWITKLLNRIKS